MLHIYDISSLRFNDLTFILLTWRKWLAPTNASRHEMGFNSGFKGLRRKAYPFRILNQTFHGHALTPNFDICLSVSWFSGWSLSLTSSPSSSSVFCTNLKCVKKNGRGPRQLSRYSDWLQTGRSWDRIPVGGKIFRNCPDRPWGPPRLLYNGYRVFPGGKERPGRDADPSPPSSAVGHERVELYLYSPYGPYGLYRASVPVQGWPLPF